MMEIPKATTRGEEIEGRGLLAITAMDKIGRCANAPSSPSVVFQFFHSDWLMMDRVKLAAGQQQEAPFF